MKLDALKNEIEAKRAELEMAISRDEMETAYEKSLEMDKLIEQYIDMKNA